MPVHGAGGGGLRASKLTRGRLEQAPALHMAFLLGVTHSRCASAGAEGWSKLQRSAWRALCGSGWVLILGAPLYLVHMECRMRAKGCAVHRGIRANTDAPEGNKGETTTWPSAA